MTRYLLTLSIVLFAALAAGCQSHSIREGVWMLTWHLQDTRTQESIEPYLEANKATVHQVEVLVEWGDETPGEVVEIRPISSHSQVGKKSTRRLPPLFGDIPVGGNELTIRGGDNSFEFRMIGRVESETHVIGRKVLARMRLDDEALEGRWSMKWVSD